MMTIISPAKNMKLQKSGTVPMSVPVYLKQAQEIGKKLKEYNPWEIQKLMNVNEKLADDCFDRLQFMKFDELGTAAVETYDGIQYKYMDPGTFTPEAKAFAQEHLRILSGMYGVLRPYDSIYEYRLEMQTRLTVGESQDLYRYWKESLYQKAVGKDRIIINLASEEYAKAVRRFLRPKDQFINCIFQVMSKGRYRVLATAAKMARGQMVRHIMENQIDTIDGLKSFCQDGYEFEPSLSAERDLVFQQRGFG